ncbi:MAG: hypothetical protein LBM98_09425 [Oscillospiraceae bacterium]|jgi:hypothetical protein|nr:hypothetical protein [Oscillospiraceae bacterium]
MKKSGSAIFLMEFIVVILSFSLSVTITLQLFVSAYQKGERSEEISVALLHAQNIAEQIKAFGSDALTYGGWVKEHTADGTRRFQLVFDDGFTAKIVFEKFSASRLFGVVRVYPPGADSGGGADEALCSLNLSRYVPKDTGGGL